MTTTTKIVMNEEGKAQIDTIIKQMLLKTSEDIVEIAKDLAPVRTGKLRDSIQILAQDEKNITIGTDCGYGAYVELGTPNEGARSFLRDACSEVKVGVE